VGCGKVGKGIEKVDGEGRKEGEPFQGWASEGGEKSFAEDGVYRCIYGNMGDIRVRQGLCFLHNNPV